MYVRVRVCSNKSKSTVNFPFPMVDDANLDNKKIPTQKLIELGIVLGILELLLELLYDLMPNFCIKNSATSYCCL